jgi:peptide-methionine (R)-S-oxide reductase
MHIRPFSRRDALLLGAAAVTASACGASGEAKAKAAKRRPASYLSPDAGKAYADSPFRTLTDAEWRARLTTAAYGVLREADTEAPFSSPLENEGRKGAFACAGCLLALFSSETKFHSGTGWPSFYQALPGAVETKTDHSAGMTRIEYHCARCLGHQGHIFEDGPPPTGLRYCNNGVALIFVPAKD